MKRFISFNGCQRPNGEQNLQPLPAMASPRRQGGHGHRRFLCPRPRLLSQPRQSRLQHHRRCSSDPSPQLSLSHEINHSSPALTLLQALTPPSEPWLCNLTTLPMVLLLTRPFRFWCQRYKSFFTKSAKNRLNKTKQNDFSPKFSNWRQFFQTIAEISLFTEISLKFLRFLVKFMDISAADILPSSFVSSPPEHEIWPKFRRKKQKFSSLPIAFSLLLMIIHISHGYF